MTDAWWERILDDEAWEDEEGGLEVEQEGIRHAPESCGRLWDTKWGTTVAKSEDNIRFGFGHGALRTARMKTHPLTHLQSYAICVGHVQQGQIIARSCCGGFERGVTTRKKQGCEGTSVGPKTCSQEVPREKRNSPNKNSKKLVPVCHVCCYKHPHTVLPVALSSLFVGDRWASCVLSGLRTLRQLASHRLLFPKKNALGHRAKN